MSIRAQSALLICLFCCTATVLTADIELGPDGRYSGILVAIDNSIGRDWGLLDKLKAAFQVASAQLATITKPVMNGTKSYAFGAVDFLLPAHWSGANGSAPEAVPWQFDEAHFRVHSTGREEPWTVQPLGCGQPGLFTLMHRRFVDAVDAWSLGRVLVHEFSHLRWGLFNEFNGHDGPHAYFSGGRLEPVRCSLAIDGFLANNQTGRACRVLFPELELEPNCRFYPHFSQPVASASIMYATQLETVRHFCAGSGSPGLEHNAEAPNPHNARCPAGLSAREVLALHEDFRAGPEVSEPDTKVNFTEVTPRDDRRLIVVMDVSRSMRGEPMDRMKQAVQNLLHQLVNETTQLALLAFSTDVQLLMPLGWVNSSDERLAYWERVRNLTAHGVTATGDAMAAAMELLGCDLNAPTRAHSGRILLITDGEENSRVRFSLAEIIEIARRTAVSVDTVAFGQEADPRLARLSALTGGRAHFAGFHGPAGSLAEVLAQLVWPDSASICLVSTQLPDSNQTSALQFYLDASVGGLQVLAVSALRPARVRLQLEPVPSGHGDVDAAAAEVAVVGEVDTDLQLGSTVLRLPVGSVQPGKWQLHLSVEPSQPGSLHTVLITGQPASDWLPPLVLRGFLSQSEARLDASSSVSVHAYLSRGAELLRPADLWARVESDDGPVGDPFRLFDHGAGADSQSADGIYSAFLPLHHLAAAAATPPQDFSIRLHCPEPVNRLARAGKLRVLGVDVDGISRLPPARVTDLRCDVNATDGLRLRWTAVGERLDSGAGEGGIVGEQLNSGAG